MQEEIKELYNKIKDKLSEEEFSEEMDKLRQNYDDVGFMNDLDIAGMVLQNHGINVNGSISEIKNDVGGEEMPFEISQDDDEKEFQDDGIEDVETSNDEEPTFTMTEDLLEKYNKVKDKLSEEEFFAKMAEYKKQDGDNPFMNDSGLADMVVGEFVTEEVEVISESPEYSDKSISDLEEGSKSVNVSGRVVSISNPRSFKTRKGGEGKVCNVELQDNTGKIRTVFWTQNMPLLKKFNEGDIIQIKNVDIKDGFSGLEANLIPRSTIASVDEDPVRYPAYEENITKIADIQPETKVNIIARIVRIPTIRSYEKNGKQGKVASLELLDDTGKITYTLWNNNVDLIESLGLEDGDTVKILQAQARERTNRDGENEISLTHWDGRIVKGDFEAPEVHQEFTAIGDVSEQRDVSIKGVVVRLQDIKKFTRKSDGSEGQLRNFDVADSTESIRVTLWGDDANMEINKGDIVKIIGGEVRYDDYTETGYSMNTNFNTQITINPENISEEDSLVFDEIRGNIRTTPIGEVEAIDEDGKEVDIIGRFLSVNDINEFQRDDGTVGLVRSAIFADESGKVQLSFWDKKADQEYLVGDAYQIENARTRLGFMDVDLNVGSNSRVIKLSEEQASAMFIPELSTLEKNIYNQVSIDQVEEDDRDIIIIGRVIECPPYRKFDRDNGDEGFVRNIEIADDTGSIKLVLWDDDAKVERELGTPIKVQNPRVSVDMDGRVEATVSRATTVLDPSESEIEKLPTFDELKEAIYVPKTIEMLYEDDTNVRVTGKITEVGSERNILKRCPNCNSTVQDEGEMEYTCQNCGHTFDKPDYLFMIPTRIKDETGEIQVTFFDNLAEELIDRKKEEIIQLVEEDDYGIEGILENLVGLTVEIIANVSFDTYNEENRLSPKKILSKYY